MNTQESHNPISSRIAILGEHWMNFVDFPEKRLCVWYLAADEHQVFQRFYDLEETAQCQTFDLFLRFNTPFVNHQIHGESLLNDLNDQLYKHIEHFGQEAAIRSWEPLKYQRQENEAPVSFIDNLCLLYKQLSKKGFEETLAIYLSPTEITDNNNYEHWLELLLGIEISECLRFMIVDEVESPVYTDLVTNFPDVVQVVEARLNMQGALQELAAGVPDPSQPGARFQQFFLELSYAVAKANVRKASLMGEKALKIAREQGWQDLQIAVFIQLGLLWTRRGDHEQAITNYQEACKIAQALNNVGDSKGPTLLIQSLFAKASAAFARQDMEDARATYEEAIPVADKSGDVFSKMEAHRMAGYCAEQQKNYELAWKHNYQALETSDQFEAIIIPADEASEDDTAEKFEFQTTLPYIGTSLLRLASIVGQNQEIPMIREKIIARCGPDWEKQVVTR